MAASSAPRPDASGLLARAEAARAAAGITRLADVTGLDRIGIPVVSAVRPLGRSLAVSQGKGATPEAARLGALLEAIELHHAESHRLPLQHGRASDLGRRTRTLAVARLPHLHGAPSDPDRPMLWTQGRFVGGGEPVLVPYDCVHCDFTIPGPPSAGLVQSSNGIGAGGTPAAALRHALLETIERDALALFAADPSGLASRLVDKGLADEETASLIARVEAAGLAVVAFDVTTDIGVTTLCCRIVERDGRLGGMAHVPEGSAADTDPRRALRRALLEAVQSRLAFISGARDDLAAIDYRPGDADGERGFWLRLAQGHRPRLAPSALPRGPDDDAAAIAWLCERLASAGLDPPVVVDLGDEDIGIPVVRVVVPGLEAPPHPYHAQGARLRAIAA